MCYSNTLYFEMKNKKEKQNFKHLVELNFCKTKRRGSKNETILGSDGAGTSLDVTIGSDHSGCFGLKWFSWWKDETDWNS